MLSFCYRYCCCCCCGLWGRSFRRAPPPPTHDAVSAEEKLADVDAILEECVPIVDDEPPPAETGDDEFERLYASVRTIVRGDIAMFPGLSVSVWGRTQQNAIASSVLPNYNSSSSWAGGPSPWFEGEFGGCVNAMDERRKGVTSAITALRQTGTIAATIAAIRGTSDATECVARTLDAACAAGNDALLVRCIDVAVRLGLVRALVVRDDDNALRIGRCRRVVNDRFRDLELSGAGDAMGWL